MQAHSAFVSAPAFFIELPSHLPLAVLRQLAAGGPLTGRFVSWELRGAELVVRCAVDALDVAHGAPSCTVGNVQGIDPTQRLDFIAAVGEAFPLTAESTFLVRSSSPAMVPRLLWAMLQQHPHQRQPQHPRLRPHGQPRRR